jgi:outer membrane protein assembly factor BamB
MWMLAALAVVLSFPASAIPAPDAEWSRFRGPNGTGVTDATNLPIELGPDKNLVWKTPLPPGHSSPVFSRSRIFVTAHSPIQKGSNAYSLSVIGLDRETGAILWQRDVPRRHKGRLENVNGPASASPVTDGDNVYAFFQDFGLISFAADGTERWRLELGPFNMFYGFGASPILVDDLVILPVDQDTGSYLIAVNRQTGKAAWKVDRPEVISGYSTPTVYRPANGPAQLLVPESFQLSAYSAADGRRLWWVRGLACEMKSVASYDNEYLYVNGWGFPQNQPGQQVATVPFDEALNRYDRNADGTIAKIELDSIDRATGDKQALMLKMAFEAFDLGRDDRLDAHDWNVFRSMMSSENGLLAIKLGGQGDMTASAIRWRYQRPVPQVPSTVLYQDTLFMVNDSGILIAFDPATGAVSKQGRLKGAIDKYFASPVAADGKVYLVSQDGTISVVSARRDWEILGVSPLGEEVFATPAIAGGRLFVRTTAALYAFANRKE